MSIQTAMTTPGSVIPAEDLSGYTRVLIIKTGAVEDHEYRRGSIHMVDTVTHEALVDKGLIEGDPDSK